MTYISRELMESICHPCKDSEWRVGKTSKKSYLYCLKYLEACFAAIKYCRKAKPSLEGR